LDLGAVVAEVDVLQDAVLFGTPAVLHARQARVERLVRRPRAAFITRAALLVLARAAAQRDGERTERHDGRPLRRHPPHRPHLTTPNVQTTPASYHPPDHGSILAALVRRDR